MDKGFFMGLHFVGPIKTFIRDTFKGCNVTKSSFLAPFKMVTLKI